jgi:hypothetical protein
VHSFRRERGRRSRRPLALAAVHRWASRFHCRGTGSRNEVGRSTSVPACVPPRKSPQGSVHLSGCSRNRLPLVSGFCCIGRLDKFQACRATVQRRVKDPLYRRTPACTDAAPSTHVMLCHIHRPGHGLPTLGPGPLEFISLFHAWHNSQSSQGARGRIAWNPGRTPREPLTSTAFLVGGLGFETSHGRRTRSGASPSRQISF